MDGTTSAKLPLSGITCNVWLWEPIWIPELYCALYVFVMGVHDVSGEAKEAKAAASVAMARRAAPHFWQGLQNRVCRVNNVRNDSRTAKYSVW